MKRLILSVAAIAIFNFGYGQTCPNGDFESWTTTNCFGPDSGWNNSNVQSLVQADTLTVWSVSGYSGQASHLQTVILGLDSEQAWITNSVGNPQAGVGGVPYSQQPTAITGYYRYGMGTGDSAGLFVGFKKNGAFISTNMFKISNATGSVATFTPFTFTLGTLTVAPDTVIIAATSSNLFSNYMAMGSWIELDQLAFTGTGITQSIPDGSFDTWVNSPIILPSQWNSNVGFNTTGVSQTTDHYSGTYAVQLVTTLNDGGSSNLKSATLTTGAEQPNNGPVGGRPYSLTTDTLYGYYKYAPAGSDTAVVNVGLYAAGSSIGFYSAFLPAAASWTLFSIPINSGTTPDTMQIDIYSSNSNSSGSMSTTIPGSTLLVDHLYLASQPLGISETAPATTDFIVYPNPANDELNFSFDNGQQYNNIEIKIYDLAGRILASASKCQGTDKITMPVGNLEPGLYLYEVRANEKITIAKFCKE